jgi:hypothetical protein
MGTSARPGVHRGQAKGGFTMTIMEKAKVARPLTPGMVVTPVDALLGVWTPVVGGLVRPEALGPGLVEKVAPDGRVRVRWLDAEVDAWMDPEELLASEAGTHVISVYHCDGRGHYTRLRHRLVDGGIGCNHNWSVELRPENIVRVVRDDGAAWTFRLHSHPGLERIASIWPEQPPEDDDAEAITVAELGIG